MSVEASSNGPETTPAVILPAVDTDDIITVAFDTTDTPNHAARWEQLISDQPHLAKELLESVTRIVPDITTREQVFDQMSFMYAALKYAAIRNQLEQPPAPDIHPAA